MRVTRWVALMLSGILLASSAAVALQPDINPVTTLTAKLNAGELAFAPVEGMTPSEAMQLQSEPETQSSASSESESSAESETQSEADTTGAPTAEIPGDLEPGEEEPTESAFVIWINKVFDLFWASFHVLGYTLAPREGYVYNQKDPFQRIFGFNEFYETMQPVALVFADTIRCKFTYEGKDWLLQFWKGAYAFCICTGGEIGIYNKPTDRSTEHYDCAREKDWIGMEMTIYNEDRPLFTRPFDQYWWITGYKFGYLDGFLRGPRTDCKMRAKLQLKDAEMAGLVAAELERLGFTLVEAGTLDHIATPDNYTIDGDMIELVWHAIMQSDAETAQEEIDVTLRPYYQSQLAA